MGRQHQGMDWPGVPQVPEGSGEQAKMEKTGCKIICGAPTTLAVKGLMMIMILSVVVIYSIKNFMSHSFFPLAQTENVWFMETLQGFTEPADEG